MAPLQGTEADGARPRRHAASIVMLLGMLALSSWHPVTALASPLDLIASSPAGPGPLIPGTACACQAAAMVALQEATISVILREGTECLSSHCMPALAAGHGTSVEHLQDVPVFAVHAGPRPQGVSSLSRTGCPSFPKLKPSNPVSPPPPDPGFLGDSTLREGAVSAFFLIFLSELGDKTFFLALLLALQLPRGLVFAGTWGALAIMTLLSVGLGRALHVAQVVVPSLPGGIPLDDGLAVVLLAAFGVQALLSVPDADEAVEDERAGAEGLVGGLLAKSGNGIGGVFWGGYGVPG